MGSPSVIATTLPSSAMTMIFGRLGPLTALYALQTRKPAVRYRFPEELVLITSLSPAAISNQPASSLIPAQRISPQHRQSSCATQLTVS